LKARAIATLPYLGKSPLQDLAGLSSHSSSQKPHFVQPLTVNPKATTQATIVSRLNTRNLTLRRDYRTPNKARERKNVDERFRRANSHIFTRCHCGAMPVFALLAMT
jgi:hypothetical protein